MNMDTVFLLILKKSPAWFVSWSFRKIFGKKSLAVFERTCLVVTKTQLDSMSVWPVPGDAIEGDKHPDLASFMQAFLMDVRSHLSAIFVRKIAIDLVWQVQGNISIGWNYKASVKAEMRAKVRVLTKLSAFFERFFGLSNGAP
jgi:hypothetical protein